jgi:nucleotide-binding universal stress UspA family protein
MFLQTILVPVEEGPEAGSAIDAALSLARDAPFPVRLTGLYVVGVSQRTGHLLRDLGGLLGLEPVLVPGGVEQWHTERGERLLEDLRTRCEADNIQMRARLEKGGVNNQLLHCASSVELVCVGLGKDGALAVAGPGVVTAERFLRRVETTVLFVPARQLSLKGITLGFDGSDGALCALRSVRRFALITGCAVQVVLAESSAHSISDDILGEAVTELGDIKIVETRRIPGEPAEVLLAAALERGHDVLAVGSRASSTLKTRVLGRVTERLLEEAEMGLLISQ